MSKLTSIFSKVWQALPFTSEAKPLVMHIELAGTIGADGRTGRNLNLKRVEKSIKACFEPLDIKAVAVTINSPGGSPVQSRLIHDFIREKAAEKEIPVYTFIQDVGASGGYILAMAGDEIFADDSSIVGSIGVIAGGFGFVDAIEKLGIDRRVYTAGKNKSQLDSFAPEKPEDIKRFKKLLDHTHQIFIDLVKDRRGEKLAQGKDDEIFSGQFWAASFAKDLGLIDGIGHLRPIMKNRFGKDVKIKDVLIDERGLLSKLMARGGAVPQVGIHAGMIDPDAVIDALEAREKWSRFGL